jgi:hypothetical protein
LEHFFRGHSEQRAFTRGQVSGMILRQQKTRTKVSASHLYLVTQQDSQVAQVVAGRASHDGVPESVKK